MRTDWPVVLWPSTFNGPSNSDIFGPPHNQEERKRRSALWVNRYWKEGSRRKYLKNLDLFSMRAFNCVVELAIKCFTFFFTWCRSLFKLQINVFVESFLINVISQHALKQPRRALVLLLGFSEALKLFVRTLRLILLLCGWISYFFFVSFMRYFLYFCIERWIFVCIYFWSVHQQKVQTIWINFIFAFTHKFHTLNNFIICLATRQISCLEIIY